MNHQFLLIAYFFVSLPTINAGSNGIE